MNLWLSVVWALSSIATPVNQLQIDGGNFSSPVLLDGETREVIIAPFRVDATPVTNAQFLEFVQAKPNWQRDNIPSLFTDAGYLSHWPENLVIGETSASVNAGENKPVTRVSWFAASAYCEAQGGRLPTLNEWEYLSLQSRIDEGISDDVYAQRVFAWYSQPNIKNLADVTKVSEPDQIQDMHGLINEWVEDYQLLTGSGDQIDILSGSCGDTARLVAEFDNAHYATFLRYQSRSNYTPRTTVSTLGFRCAYNVE